MMIAAHAGRAQLALAEHRAPELGGEHHQRVVEQSPLPEILHQRGRRLIDVPALVGELPRDGNVLVPAPVKELHEPDVSLQEPTGQQTVGCVAAGLAHLGPVRLERRGRLPADVGEIRHRGLHPERHLIGLDPGECLRVAHLLRSDLVEPGEVVEQGAPLFAVHPGRVLKEKHRAAPRPQPHALVGGGKETAAPEPGENRLPGIFSGALGNHGDEGRQVLVFRAEPVAHPGPHAGVTRQLIAGVHEGDPGIVVDGLGVHALDDAELVGDGLDPGQQIADPRALFAAAFAGFQGRHHGIRGLAAGHSGEPLRTLHAGRKLLAGVLVKHRFVVEEVHVREPAALEQAEHAFRLRRKMRQAQPGQPVAALGLGRAKQLGLEEAAQGEAADSAGDIPEKRSAGEMRKSVDNGVHGEKVSCE